MGHFRRIARYFHVRHRWGRGHRGRDDVSTVTAFTATIADAYTRCLAPVALAHHVSLSLPSP